MSSNNTLREGGESEFQLPRYSVGNVQASIKHMELAKEQSRGERNPLIETREGQTVALTDCKSFVLK